MAKKAYIGVGGVPVRILPSGYTQVEYIQSSGTQYIDTGFAPNQDTKAVLDIQMVNASTQRVFGARTELSVNSFFVACVAGGTQFRADYGTEQNIHTVNSVYNRIVINLSKTASVIDGIAIPFTSETFSPGVPICLFAANTNGVITSDNRAQMKLFSCQIYDNGAIVRDYVPCVNSSNVAGLYDLVNGVFYTNAGTGSFTVGNTVTGDTGVARQVKKGYIGVGGVPVRSLPSGYTQVEYIQSSGTQYIDTRFKPNQDTRVVMDAVLTEINTTIAANAFFGARTTATLKAYGVQWHVSKSAVQHFYNDVYTLGATLESVPARQNIDSNKNVLIYNNVTDEITYESFQCDYYLYLFAMNEVGVASYLGNVRVYSCKIYDNDILVRDYVPCTNTSNVAGLYDLVNGVFYTNAGTGSFTVGSVVTEDTSVARKIKKAYIGIGGVARPFWSGDGVEYYGSITPLSQARDRLAATTVGNYALFGGGSYFSTVDAYNLSLTRTTATGLSTIRSDLAATTVGNYGLFGGGYETTSYIRSTVDAYNTSLTRKTATALSVARFRLAATTVGNYALFGGGYNEEEKSTVDAYNTSLTRTTATSLSQARDSLAATTVGNYALFGGGSSTVDAYNTSLTRINVTNLTGSGFLCKATTVGDYALFAGFYLSTVNAYNTSLTRTTATPLSEARHDLAATTVGNYGLFGGGYVSSVVDAYNTSLTRTTATPLSEARAYLAATTVGNYALFGGGYGSTGDSSVVDAYIVTE